MTFEIKQPIKVNVFRVNQELELPKHETENAACFDLRANFGNKCQSMKAYTDQNKQTTMVAFPPENITDQESSRGRVIDIPPGYRVLIPTGLIFDIPEGYSIRLHARSSLALKEGLTIANAEGIIDSDYIHQTYVMVTNISRVPIRIVHGDRIAQAELVPMYTANLQEIMNPPTQKTDRTGGFGSTGKD